jgi:hypothetical protein
MTASETTASHRVPPRPGRGRKQASVTASHRVPLDPYGSRAWDAVTALPHGRTQTPNPGGSMTGKTRPPATETP